MNVSDHPGRAEELIAMITADGHPDLQLTALAAVAEEVLVVADEVAGLRELLTVKPSPGPGTPSVPSPERGVRPCPSASSASCRGVRVVGRRRVGYGIIGRGCDSSPGEMMTMMPVHTSVPPPDQRRAGLANDLLPLRDWIRHQSLRSGRSRCSCY
jgi:hypothetical protein